MDFSALPRDQILVDVQTATGLRASPRLTAAADIVWLMAVSPPFKRIDVVQQFESLGLSARCVDRALRELEHASLVRVIEGNADGQGGGKLYEIVSSSETTSMPSSAE